MTTTRSHRELKIYQLAFETATRIHEITKSFPSEDEYSLTNQIRRSSYSVCTHIAEAWRRRQDSNNFVSELTDSDSEVIASTVWLEFALHFKYITPELHKELAHRYDHICHQLTLMISDPEKWAHHHHE